MSVGNDTANLKKLFEANPLFKPSTPEDVAGRPSGKQGTPITRFGQIRNECWNCDNYSEEKDFYKDNEPGQKQYYPCSFCGKAMHT